MRGSGRDSALEALLHSAVEEHQGKVAVHAADLRAGAWAAIDADALVPAASTIKLAILHHALTAIHAGSARLDETLTLTPENQVEGSGVLLFFDTPLTLTLKDALTMMIVVSDNSATNLVIDRFGIEAINAGMRTIGLRETTLYKKVFAPSHETMPPEQPRFGLGKTTAREMTELMRRLTSEPARSESALPMLLNQSDREGIPRYLGKHRVASKSGAVDASRSDVGLVYAPNGPIIISIFTYENADRSWTPDNAGGLLIARLAQTIVERWSA